MKKSLLIIALLASSTMTPAFATDDYEKAVHRT